MEPQPSSSRGTRCRRQELSAKKLRHDQAVCRMKRLCRKSSVEPKLSNKNSQAESLKVTHGRRRAPTSSAMPVGCASLHTPRSPPDVRNVSLRPARQENVPKNIKFRPWPVFDSHVSQYRKPVWLSTPATEQLDTTPATEQLVVAPVTEQSDITSEVLVETEPVSNAISATGQSAIAPEVGVSLESTGAQRVRQQTECKALCNVVSAADLMPLPHSSYSYRTRKSNSKRSSDMRLLY